MPRGEGWEGVKERRGGGCDTQRRLAGYEIFVWSMAVCTKYPGGTGNDTLGPHGNHTADFQDFMTR